MRSMDIEKSSFIASTQLFAEVSEEDIVKILESSISGQEMISILKLIKHDFYVDCSYEDKLNYYKKLVDLISANTQVEYSDRDKSICVASLVGLLIDSQSDDDKAFSLCNSIIEMYNDEVDNLSDEIWFSYERMRYSVLASYHKSHERWDPEAVLALANSLKANKERYETLLNLYK